MKFRYRAVAPGRSVVTGMIDAGSEEAAEQTLYQAGYEHILRLKEISPGDTLGRLVPSLFGVKQGDVIDFSRQLATLLEAAVPVVTALHLLEGHTGKTAFRHVLSTVAEDLRGGSSLSRALSRHRFFPESYCQVLRASEQAGTLDTGLRLVAAHLERGAQTRGRVRKAMMYPAMVLLMALGVAVLLTTVVLPPLLGLFEAFAVELPWSTRMILALNDLATGYGAYALGAGVLTGVALVMYARTRRGHRAAHHFLLRLPLTGPIIIDAGVFHFCESSAMMLKAGLHLTSIMEIVVNSSSNLAIREALRNVQDRLTQGEGLSGPLSDNQVFPEMLARMVALGETTGSMDTAMAILADYYEQRVDQRISALVSMIGPALTFGIGLVVAFMALAIIMPLYSIMGSL